MRPRPHEIEVLDAIIAVVDAKPCGLPKQRLKAEGGAEVRVQLALEVGGREIMAGHHVAPEAGDQPLLQIIEDAVAIDGADLVPIDRQLAQMRQGRSEERREGKEGERTWR